MVSCEKVLTSDRTAQEESYLERIKRNEIGQTFPLVIPPKYEIDNIQSLKTKVEMLEHQVSYLMKEHKRMSDNEARLWKGCDDLDLRVAQLEKSR